MTVSVMMGEQGREAFERAVRNGPPPMNENQRRALAAQCYPMLPEDQPYVVLDAKPRVEAKVSRWP